MKWNIWKELKTKAKKVTKFKSKQVLIKYINIH